MTIPEQPPNAALLMEAVRNVMSSWQRNYRLCRSSGGNDGRCVQTLVGLCESKLSAGVGNSGRSRWIIGIAGGKACHIMLKLVNLDMPLNERHRTREPLVNINTPRQCIIERATDFVKFFLARHCGYFWKANDPRQARAAKGVDDTTG
jgi:hypothetical protein